jgi:hypothetical protein
MFIEVIVSHLNVFLYMEPQYEANSTKVMFLAGS